MGTWFFQGSSYLVPRAYGVMHRMHHVYSDTEKDPHSPLKFQNGILGFLWSHIGWMLLTERSTKNISKVTIEY